MTPSKIDQLEWYRYYQKNWLRYFDLGKGAKKKEEKILTSVSFMYVCVAGNGEMLVFFPFSPQQ